jgi:hypothetical protein
LSRHDSGEGRKDRVGKVSLEEGQCVRRELEMKKPPPPFFFFHEAISPLRHDTNKSQVYRILLFFIPFLLLDKIRSYKLVIDYLLTILL